MALENYKNDIYAGVLGKIIGVYLGRPVEGWTFETVSYTHLTLPTTSRV